CDQAVIHSVGVVSDLLKHQRSQRFGIDTYSFSQGSQVIAGPGKDITGVATTVVDELQDRGVQFYELPEQIERKPRMLDTDIFDDHRAQSIKFDDDLAASLIRWHGTRLGKASKALADGRLENGRAFLGRDRQVYGL